VSALLNFGFILVISSFPEGFTISTWNDLRGSEFKALLTTNWFGIKTHWKVKSRTTKRETGETERERVNI